MKKFYALMLSSIILSACSGSSAPTAESQASAEAVVNAFYDALEAGDTNAALEYVDPSVRDSEDFQDTWSEVSTWTFNSADVVSTDGSYVKVEFSVTIEGEEDSGTDDVTVVESDGKWWIVEIPS